MGQTGNSEWILPLVRELESGLVLLETEQLALYQRPDELHQSFYFEFLRAQWDDQILYDVVDRLGAIAGAGGGHGRPDVPPQQRRTAWTGRLPGPTAVGRR